MTFTCLGIGTLAIWLLSWAIAKATIRTSVVGASFFRWVHSFRLFFSHWHSSFFFSASASHCLPANYWSFFERHSLSFPHHSLFQFQPPAILANYFCPRFTILAAPIFMYVIPDIGLDEQIEQGWFDLCRFDVWTVLAHNLAAKARDRMGRVNLNVSFVAS